MEHPPPHPSRNGASLGAVSVLVTSASWSRSQAKVYGGLAAARSAKHNRVGAGLTPAPPTPPDMRVRIRRFASRPGNGGRDR